MTTYQKTTKMPKIVWYLLENKFQTQILDMQIREQEILKTKYMNKKPEYRASPNKYFFKVTMFLTKFNLL